MKDGAVVFGEIERACRLGRPQLAIAVAASALSAGLDATVGRGGAGARRALAMLNAAWALASGSLWFSIGWLGAGEHGLSDREAALAGGLTGALGSTAGVLIRWATLPLMPDDGGGRKPRAGELWMALPAACLAGFVFGGLLAALGAREARKRG